VSVRGEGSWAVLEVEDTGVGVPDHEVPRLFERFHRVQGTHGRTHEGSGIGLALVQELVKQHGGSVVARSSQGQGSTFTVRIPFGADHLPQDRLGKPPLLAAIEIGAQTFVQEALRWLPGSKVKTAGETHGPGPSSPELASHKSRFASTLGSRIVLADDNADMRDYLQALLQPFYEVEAVADGEQALESIRRLRPALVLSDVMMPKLDGFGFLKALRADPTLHSLPVILLSARAGEESRIEGLDSGADDYLIKPFAARELLARVGSLVERSRVQQELEAADLHKNEFLAMLAHELRNPLAPIRNAGELLSRTFPGNSNVRAATATIERQVTHLSRMVDDLLDISRITQGRIELRMKPVAFAEVISRGIEIVGPVIQQKRHRVTFVSSRRPLLVNGDPERLVQCISNVLTNAAKYTDPRGEIHVEESEREGEAVVTITDNGAGIPAELLPRIFDLFVQGDRTLDRAQGGLGIGLSIVKRVLEKHNGKIVASSDGAGRGSKFEIRLPLMEASATLSGKAATAKSPARRIVVVDDNTDSADSLTMVLGFDGHEVLAVYTGLQAIEQAERFKPDVMLIDIGLPDLDGYEVARRIRAIPALQSICLVAVTGYGQDADKDRAHAAGFSEHLVKPIEFPTLERVLTTLPKGKSR
jgi:signal transduction histidine kinase